MNGAKGRDDGEKRGRRRSGEDGEEETGRGRGGEKRERRGRGDQEGRGREGRGGDERGGESGEETGEGQRTDGGKRRGEPILGAEADHAPRSANTTRNVSVPGAWAVTKDDGADWDVFDPTV
jgi:hypothetical protein